MEWGKVGGNILVGYRWGGYIKVGECGIVGQDRVGGQGRLGQSRRRGGAQIPL